MTPAERPIVAITADAITWALPRSTRRERIPARLLERLSHDDLLAYCEDCQDDLAALRVTLQEAIHALASVTSQRDRLRRVMRGPRR